MSPQKHLGWLIWRCCRIVQVNCRILKNWDIRNSLLRFEIFEILWVPLRTQKNLTVTNFLHSETLPEWVALLRINTIEKGEGNHHMPALSVNLHFFVCVLICCTQFIIPGCCRTKNTFAVDQSSCRVLRHFWYSFCKSKVWILRSCHVIYPTWNRGTGSHTDDGRNLGKQTII